MTRILFLAASLGLAASGAQACDFMKSAAKVDTSTTASVSTQDDADAADVDADDGCHGSAAQRATPSSSSNPNRIVPARSTGFV